MSQDVDEYAEQIGQFKAGHGKFHAQDALPISHATGSCTFHLPTTVRIVASRRRIRSFD